MKLRLELAEAEKIPLGYGIAYADIQRDVWVLYPIPVNLIVRFLSQFHDRVRVPLWGRDSYDALVKRNLKLVGDIQELNKRIRQMKVGLELSEDRYHHLEGEYMRLKKTSSSSPSEK